MHTKVVRVKIMVASLNDKSRAKIDLTMQLELYKLI